MRRSFGRIVVFQALLILLAGVAACNKSKSNEQANQGNVPPGGPGGPGGQWPMMGGPGGPGGRPRGPIGELMTKLAKGKQSINGQIGEALKANPTPWDTIQPQAKEYAQMASKLGEFPPPKGEPASWKKMADAFAHSASELQQASDTKNLEAANKAFTALSGSCKSCHDAHRGGPGGPGMRPGGFPGGPPPGGFPGGPPGGPPPGGFPGGPPPQPQQ